MSEATVVSCHFCDQVQSSVNSRCELCGHRLAVLRSQSLQHCWSLLFTGMIFYIPANLLPIMRTTQIGGDTYSTITSGVVLLWEHGSWFIAGIIFFASLLIPLAKFIAIAGLCLSHRHPGISPAGKITVFRVTEFIGRWSMVDVFVVGFLAALIQMGSLMSIHPGPAALAFAGMVICTMLAANSIDPRIFWQSGVNPDE